MIKGHDIGALKLLKNGGGLFYFTFIVFFKILGIGYIEIMVETITKLAPAELTSF